MSLSLAACAEQPDEAAAEATEVPAEEAGVVIGPGLYAVGDETTEYGRTRLNADGTYVDLDGDTPVGGGTWRTDGETMCFDPEGDGEDQQERCWTNGPADADGGFLSTRTDGSQSYRVTPIEG
ncbi:hypothetical protein OZN62_13290 [Aurantiacibacter sp. MUD11]|uniref:hypothetical protein n=1 Tax=Aurantiacibacter sp. MUD11 TaxID=3003265 RepID=UPI0022AA0148|nr:hypothetical protein [Aurantiacibacter sp. MUD11]WAT17871.1 hypothetical protein OZN62_13290 [Aurantiacibacter sp. MUD11]